MSKNDWLGLSVSETVVEKCAEVERTALLRWVG